MTKSLDSERGPGVKTSLAFGVIALLMALVFGLSTGDLVWAVGMALLGAAWIGYALWLRYHRRR